MKIESAPKIERKTDTEYLELLKTRLVELGEELRVAEEQYRELVTTPIDSDDERGDRQNEKQTAEETLTRIGSQIEEAEKAIRWAEKNGFVCAVCGKEIETARLNIDTASITCIEHKGQEDEIEV